MAEPGRKEATNVQALEVVRQRIAEIGTGSVTLHFKEREIVNWEWRLVERLDNGKPPTAHSRRSR